MKNSEQAVKHIAKENFKTYPEDYPLKNGISPEETTIAVQELAISYFENRTESEIKRDEKEEITKIDYVNWVMEAFSDFIS